MSSSRREFIAALDVGTTTLRCAIVDSRGELVSLHSVPTKLIRPQAGHHEIPPEALWEDTLMVIKTAIAGAGLTPADIAALGIATQRGTFITWDRETGAPYHNFITWRDARCAALVAAWNRSLRLRACRAVAYGLYVGTRAPRFLAASTLAFTSAHASMRLLHVLESVPRVRANIKRVRFGTMDTWLLHKLTAGRLHATDCGNATSTGLADPFAVGWSALVRRLLRIPLHILPEIVANDHDLGSTEASVFGVPLRIGALAADAQAAMVGAGCWRRPRALKLTMGTGAFLNAVTPRPHPSAAATIYPLVCYQLAGELCYMAEGACSDAGTAVEWAVRAGLCAAPADTARMAAAAACNGGVYFCGGGGGDGGAFVGVTPATTREHMVRAVLESIVFRIMLRYAMLRAALAGEIDAICVDGGVSRNDFVCQLLADLAGVVVERATCSEMSAVGAAYVAGLNIGIWKSKEHLLAMRRVERTFHPSEDQLARQAHFCAFDTWRRMASEGRECFEHDFY